jgi:hypothetical protein
LLVTCRADVLYKSSYTLLNGLPLCELSPSWRVQRQNVASCCFRIMCYRITAIFSIVIPGRHLPLMVLNPRTPCISLLSSQDFVVIMLSPNTSAAAFINRHHCVWNPYAAQPHQQFTPCLKEKHYDVRHHPSYNYPPPPIPDTSTRSTTSTRLPSESLQSKWPQNPKPLT